MAIGRISGPLLKANLLRQGVDLAFENDLLYLDVSDPNPANHKIGIKKSDPNHALDVAGNINATSITTPNLTATNVVVTNVSSDILPSQPYTYNLGNNDFEWKSLTVGQIAVDAFFIDGNTITTIDSNADIDLKPQGTGTVVINSNTALRIPYGTEQSRPLGQTAQIRFNTDNLQFEGYNGAGWVSLGATRDIDGNTRITAELSTGVNDNTFRFYNDGTLTGTWDINRLDLHKLTIDDNLILDQNTITTTRSNTDLVLKAHGIGKVTLPDNDLELDHSLSVAGVTNLNSTTINGAFDVNGTATVDDVIVNNDLTVTGNIFGDYVQTTDVQISGTVITTTNGNSNLQLRASGTGEVRIEENATITGNAVINGDLRIDGQDLTSSTTTFNLVNTTATTVNFAGSATTIEIGASTGTTSINHNLTVDGNVTLGNASGDTVTFNSSIVNAPNTVTFTVDDANNTYLSYPLSVRHTTTGTPSAGMGTGIRFVAETGIGINKVGMSVDAETTDVTSATEDFDFVVRLMDDGNLAAERFRVSSTGTGTLVGNLNVQGGTISTTAGEANIVNENASTVNFAGDASAINIGSNTGITTINNNVDIAGDVNIDGDTISTTSATLNLANENTTTVNAFGSATSITIGSDTGTTTIRNDVVVDGGITVNNDSEIRFKEAIANGDSYAALQAPEQLAESYVLKLPTSKGSFGQLLTNAGDGQMQWSPADTLVGNRLYVSDAYGDDANNGFDAPVKSIKRAVELINEQIYTPKRTVSVAEQDVKRILVANKDYLKAEITGFIDNNFAFEYNSAKCSRDTGLIVQSLAFDLLFDGTTQTNFAGLQYWAQAATSVPGQVAETVAAIQHAKSVAMAVAVNTTVTKQTGNAETQVFDLANPGSSGAATLIGQRFDLVINIINNGTAGISDSIINNGAETSDSGYLNAFALLQSNKEFIKADTIAYINQNFAFTYDDVACARDTGLIVQSLAFDLLQQGSTQSQFAGLQYWNQGTNNVGTQSDETILSIQHAKLVAQQVVQNIPIVKTVGNSATQVFDFANPGSGAGATIIGQNFDRVLNILDGTEQDITNTIVNNGLVSTSNSILNTYELLLDNKEFIKSEVIAYIDQNFRYTYDETICRRDAGLIIDGVSYDLALNTNYNAITAGLAYQRANASYVESNQIAQTLAAIGQTKTDAAASLISSSTAVSRSNAAFDEILDILRNGSGNADTIVFTAPSGVDQNKVDAKDQLQQNRNFLKAEVTAYIDKYFVGYVYDASVQAKCERDVGYIVDAASYDAALNTNYNAITAGLAYSRANSAYVLSDQKPQTVQGILKSLETALTVSSDSTFESRYTSAIDEVVDIIQNGAVSADAIAFNNPTGVAQDKIDAKVQLQQNKEFIKAEVAAYVDENFVGYVYTSPIQTKCERDIGYILDAVAYDMSLGTNYNAVTTGLAYQRSNSAYVLTDQNIQTTEGIKKALEVGLTYTSNATAESRMNSAVTEIIDIIQNGEVAADALTFPSPTGVNQDLVDAKDQLVQNRAFIQAEIIAYVNANNPPAGIDTDICGRDAGYIVDALCYDVLYGGNSATVRAAEAYFVGTNPVISNGTEITATVAAWARLQSIVSDIIQGIEITKSVGNAASQITSGGLATATEASTLYNLVQIIKNVITSANLNSLPAIIYPTTAWVSSAINSDRAALLSAKSTIQSSVSLFLTDNFSGFTYDSTKCKRDVGYIVDALTYDILYGGNSATVRAADAYFVGAAGQLADGQSQPTILAYTRMQSVIADIVQGISVTPTTGNTEVQITSGGSASSTEATDLSNLVDIIKAVILAGDISGLPAVSYPSTAWVAAGIEADRAAVIAAKTTIKNAVSTYLTDNFSGFVYDSAKCARDVGYIVDALSYDILYGGNSAVSTNALAYFVGATAQLGAKQKSATLLAYSHLNSVISSVVQGNSVSVTSGNIETQITSGGVATATEVSALAGLISVITDYITVDGTVAPTVTYPDLAANNVSGELQTARTQLITDKSAIIDSTINFIASEFQTLSNDVNYSSVTCARDVDYMIDCVAFDLTHGGNRQSTQAGTYYYQHNGSSSVIATERPQTVAAYEHLKTLVAAVITNQAPATSYQNSVARIAGLPATSTEVLAIQNNIDIIINVIENGPSVVTSTEPIGLVSSTSTNIRRAFDLLRANEEYIKAEINGYIQETFADVAGYDSVKCARDTGYIVDSICFDMKYGGNRQTIQSGVYYYTNTASVSVIPGESIQTVAAYNFLKTLVSAVVLENAYTPLQNVVTRDISGTPATSAEYTELAAKIDLMIDIIENGPTAADPKEAIGLTPVNSVDVTNAYNQLIANEAFIKAEIIQYINNEFTGLVYNKETCSRDIGYMIDAVVYDLHYGGNAKSIYSGEVYYNATTSANVVVNQQKTETAQAVEHLRTIAANVLRDEDPVISYSAVSRVPVAEIAGVTTTALARASSITAIQNNFRIISDTLTNGVGYVRPIDYGQGYWAATGSIYVASGDYIEDNPLIIPDNVSIIGADLRSVIIRPKNSKKNMFHMRNGSYMAGFTWRDNVDPVTRVPLFTWNFATTFDDVEDKTVPRGGYPQVPLTKPIIVQSPYIQNVSIISFLGGSGALIDGNLTESPNIPQIVEEVEVAFNRPTPNTFIPEQGKSMVANAYTMVSFGGIGWKLINDAYAQIVSCFQIFLLEGVVCQSGGYCSITNSATNFGLYALRASGYSPNAFTFDRAWICSTGIARGAQSLTIIGTRRIPVNEFVVRIRSKDDTTDLTPNYLVDRENFYFDPASVDPETDVFTIPNHSLANKVRVTYYNGGGVSIGGLESGQSYFVYNIDIDHFKLYFDESLTIPMDITSVGTGGQTIDNDPVGAGPEDSTLHVFKFVNEEFFIRDSIESSDLFQKLTLTPGSYTFTPGATITATSTVDGVPNTPNNAYVYSYNPTTYELVIAVNNVTINNVVQRVPFNLTSIIAQDQSLIPVYNISVTAFEAVTGYWNATFTIQSTVTNSLMQNMISLPGYRIWLHRPSIVNSSSHTWEYAGSGIDYNALPQNGGQTREEYEQYFEEPGRVYTSGTNELGDFKVGDFIVAENKTGNISFRNEVTVGQLNALRLSLSDIEINKISNDPGLGDNEPGGPSDTALITQLSIRTFIANRLGAVLDKQVSTNANAGALVQLNSSGQINKDLIPPMRSTNTVTTRGFDSRLEISEDQPAIDALASDTVIEIYDARDFVLSGNITISRSSVIRQRNSGAYGEVTLDVSANNEVTIADIRGVFTTNPADILTDVNDVPLGAGNVYPTTIGASVEYEIPYILTIDTESQFLVLYDKTTGADYSFTTGNLVTSTINTAVGQVVQYKSGVIVDLNTIIYNKGTGYTPTSGTYTYLDVPLTGGTGTGARADITVTNGQVANVDLRRGGTGYVVAQNLSCNNADIGGTGVNFSIPVTNTHQRLYVDLVDGVKFIGTESVPDFIADDNAPVKTIANLTTSYTKAFDANAIGSGGNVDYTLSRITITAHGYSDGDAILYTSGANPVIGPLQNNATYHVKVVDNDTIELCIDYNIVTKVNFTISSTGTHSFTMLPANFVDNVFYVPAHGFTTGDPVEISGANPPSGLTAPRYYVGSVTTNNFSLHELRIDALASVGGNSVNEELFVNSGSGSLTFTLQNVQIVGNINTTSTNRDAYSVLSTSNVDAANIISGIINTSRLGTGAANTNTFLRGDNSWQTVLTSARPSVDSPVTIAGPFDTDSTTNFYYGDIQIDVERVSGIRGDVNWTNVGVVSFSKGMFDVSTDGQVSVKSGRIDALTLGGLSAAYFLDPSNLSTPVPVNRGGTGLIDVAAGSMLFGSSSGALGSVAIGSANTILTSNGSTPVWSPNISLTGNLTVGGDTTLGNASGDLLTINAGTASVPNALLLDKDDGSNTAVSYPLSVRHSTSGVPIAGIGTGIQLITETAGNNFEVGTVFESVTTSVSGGGESFDAIIKTMTTGATAAQVLKVNNNSIVVGANNTATTLTTQGTSSLTLNTNGGTNSGSIVIAQGTNGNITITPNGTGVVNVGKTVNITGDLTVTGTTSIGGVFLTAGSLVGATVLTTVDSFNRTVYRSAKYQIQVQCTAGPDNGAFQTSELLVIHNGTTPYATEYALVKTGANELATFTVDISGDDVRLRVTPTTSDTINIRIVRTAQPI